MGLRTFSIRIPGGIQARPEESPPSRRTRDQYKSKLRPALLWQCCSSPERHLLKPTPEFRVEIAAQEPRFLRCSRIAPVGSWLFSRTVRLDSRKSRRFPTRANNGLGPRFNANQCSSCHAQPAIGGTGAATNPQFVFPSNGVAPGNTIPSFITANGPTREARFPFFFNSNGTVNTNAPNGGVEDLFTVTGRSDAGTCNSSNPAAAQLRHCA